MDTLKYLSSKIQEDIKIITDDLAMGGCKDHGDYKFHCGRVRGLITANNFIVELAERMEGEDD